VVSGGFLKRRRRGRGGGGSKGGCRVEVGNREERGVLGRGVGQCSGAASVERALEDRRGTSRGRPNRGGAEGPTGGPRPQCWVAAPEDRRA
jgi:hypothetical protein